MMSRFFQVAVLLTLISACSTTPERPRPAEWQGEWDAVWETLPESYPGIENVDFTMNGSFTFVEDSLTVQTNGYEGCIFTSDTLIHTQSWYVQNDTLFLLNDPNLPGMTYLVTGKSEDQIKLQLMEDIFITLRKASPEL